MQTVGLLLGLALLAVAIYGLVRLHEYPPIRDDEQITG